MGKKKKPMMKASPNLHSVTAIEKYPPCGFSDYEDDNQLLLEAQNFINFFNWCERIEETYVGYILREILGIYLFKIASNRADVDDWIWVIVGDVPPSYLTVDECKTPSEALDGYIGAMEEWVEAAKSGNRVDNLIPVDIDANPSNAKMLKKRLKFLDDNILPKIRFLEQEIQI